MTSRWRFVWAWTVGVVLGAAGCSSLPTRPPAPPPGPTCPELSVPWCHEAGMSCGECKHQPPGEACPVKAPPCEAPPVPPAPPATECQPTLAPALSAPAAPASAWPVAADQSLPSDWKQAVLLAEVEAQTACPTAWSGGCMAGGPSAIDHGYLLIAHALQRRGIAASQAVVDGEKKDHLWVRRAPASNDWNAAKLFHYGNGCLITADSAFTVHGWYTYAGAAPSPPPPSGSCPVAPCPDPTWTAATLPDGWGSDEIGRARWQFNSSIYVGRYLDNTAVVIRNEPYCAAIGLSPYADGQPRASCPVRPDGHADRAAIELWLTGGYALESRAGATCAPHPSNPVMFEIGTGDCRLCSLNRYPSKTSGAPPEPVCGEWR